MIDNSARLHKQRRLILRSHIVLMNDDKTKMQTGWILNQELNQVKALKRERVNNIIKENRK